MTLRVVKVGTSLLRGHDGQTTPDVIEQLTADIAANLEGGDRVVLVSSGAVAVSYTHLTLPTICSV